MRFRDKVLERLLLTFPAGLSFTLYLLTLGRGIGLADSGELALAVKTLGVAHPPGFPAYTMVAHLATLVPVGSVAQRINMFSAFCGAAAVAAFAFLAFELLAERSSPGSREGARASLERLIVAGAVSVTALALGASVILWSWSVVVEVYSLNLALLLWALACVARSRRAGAAGTRVLLGAAGLLTGLALGVHVVTVLFFLPALVLMARTKGRGLFAYWPLVLGGLVGVASYLYLPIAAAADPLLNWGEPDTWDRFLRHVTGVAYRSNVKISASTAGRELGTLGSLFFRQLSPVGLVVAAWGMIDLWQRRRFAAYAVLAALAPTAVFGLVWIVPDGKDAYYLPAFSLLALAVAAGLLTLGRDVIFAAERDTPSLRGLRRRAVAAGVGALILLVGPSAALATGPARQKARPTATVVAHDTLRGVAPKGTILVSSWEIFAPLLYLQNVEGLRPDVRIVGTKLLYWTWYYDMLRRQYPDLVGPCDGPVSDLLPEMEKYESDRAFDKELLFRKLDEVIDGFVQVASRRGPVYYMPPFEADTGAGYRRVPRGLAYQMLAWDDAVPRPERPNLQAVSLVRATPGVGGDALRRLYAYTLSEHATHAGVQEGRRSHSTLQPGARRRPVVYSGEAAARRDARRPAAVARAPERRAVSTAPMPLSGKAKM